MVAKGLTAGRELEPASRDTGVFRAGTAAVTTLRANPACSSRFQHWPDLAL